MKNILTVFVMGALLYSCNNPNNSSKKETKATPQSIDKPVLASDPTVQDKAVEDKKEPENASVVSVKQIIEGYLSLKNALTKDDSKAASDAAQRLFSILKKVDISKLSPEKDAELRDIIESAAENAEHISENSEDIAHQREHLLSLSNDIADLIGEKGTDGLKLYQDFCPMYNNGKGGTWISEFKEIVNPYEGSKMINCGSIKKVL